MPIIGLNGKVIKEEDIGFLTEMLRGSLENHIYHLTEWQRTAAARAEDPAFYDRILQHFRNGVDHLSEKINAAREGNRKIKVPDLIKEVYSGISREIVEQLRQEDMNQLGISVAVDSFLNYEASEWGDGNLAREYPNVAFFCISDKGEAKNCTSYFARLYQARYLAGIIAGKASKTGILGYVSAMPNSQTNRGINAYALGMRKANPQAKLVVCFTGSWDDEKAQRESVSRLAAEGADVITYHEDKPHAIQLAEAMGLYTIGYGSTKEKYSPRYLTAALYDWDVVYKKVLGDYMSGRMRPSREYWLGLEEGGVRLDNMSSLVAPKTRDLVELEQQRIRKQDVFTGLIRDNAGKIRCEDGEQISDHELFYGMDWFVEGVEIHD